jgi:hypothetical protein
MLEDSTAVLLSLGMCFISSLQSSRNPDGCLLADAVDIEQPCIKKSIIG